MKPPAGATNLPARADGSGLIFQGPEPRLPSGPYDVVVVGAGIYGLPVAYFLAAGYGARVLVVEDNTIPGECITVNTGGIIRVAYSNPDVIKVAAFAREIYINPTDCLELKTPLTAGFIQTGWARFIHADAAGGSLSAIERIADRARDLGIGGLRVESRERFLGSLTPSRRENLEKIVDLKDLTHVLVDDRGGYADGGTALLAFFQACLEAGVSMSLYSTVTDFLRVGDRVTGLVLDRWSRSGEERRLIARERVYADRIVLAAGKGNAALVRLAAGWEMPTFCSYHQTPYIRNSPDLDFRQTAYPRDTIDAPVISHWRGIYFRPEGSGLLCGIHHGQLQPDDYHPTGGTIDTGGWAMRVGLDQVMVDRLLELMPYFPVLSSHGLNMGRTPADIPGGVYYMNPEELPFEGEVPRTAGTVYYAGSGCGTGFKLGPGVACLLAQRLMGIRREDRLIPSASLSAERAEYFYPAGTSREELLKLFRPVREGGRLVDMGAAGIAPSVTP